MKLASMKPKRPALSNKAAAEQLTAEELVKISVRVPKDFRQRLRMLSVERDCEMQEMVIEALRAHFSELENA